MGLGAIGAAILSVKILVDASDAAKGMGDAATGVQKMQAKIGGLVEPAALVGGAIVGMGKSALSAASDAEQAMGGVDTVFGKSADKVKAWGDQAAKSSGLSATEYAVAAAKIGSQLKTAGVPMDQIAGKTKELIQHGADLAATYGGTAAEGVDALSSAMKGEADPAERLGLGLSAAAVKAEMVAEGTDKLTGSAASAAKAQATMNLITKQGAASWGQFAAQSGTAAEAQQIAGASMANMASTLGTVLLPAATAVGNAMAVMAEWIQKNSTLVLVLVGVVGALAAGILAASAALKIYQMAQTLVSAATKIWAGVQWLLNAALNANPIALVVIAVVALIAVIVLLWNKCDAFRNFFIGVWAAIQAAAAATWNAIKAGALAVMAAVSAVWNAIKTAAAAVWNWIKSAVAAVWSGIQTAARAAGAAVAAVWAGIKNAAAAAWTWIKSAVSAVLSGITTAARAVGSAAAAVWRGIQSAAATAWHAIQSAVAAMAAGVTAVWRGIQSAIDGVLRAIQGLLQRYISFYVGVWQSLVGAVAGVWNSIARVVASALEPIKSAISSIASMWDNTVGRISAGIDKVKGWLSGIAGKVAAAGRAVVPGAAPAVGGYPIPAGTAGLSARALAGPAATSSSSSGGSPTFVIQGALDPDAVARQIKAILTGRDRRAGGVHIGGLAA